MSCCNHNCRQGRDCPVRNQSQRQRCTCEPGQFDDPLAWILGVVIVVMIALMTIDMR